MSINARYRCIIDDPNQPTKVIVLSKYAGKDVRGVAKCSPNDRFDLKTGETLAKLRCDEKVAWKRVKRARRKIAEATEELRVANQFYEDMSSYLDRSLSEYDEVVNKLRSFEEGLN
jgi:hypothetical protein